MVAVDCLTFLRSDMSEVPVRPAPESIMKSLSVEVIAFSGIAAM